MQAVDNSHLIGKRSNGVMEEESYGPDTTVWHIATDVIHSASGTPVWKFIQLWKNLTKAELIEILHRINVAGSTLSHSDTVAEIQEQKEHQENCTTIINLDYVPNHTNQPRTLFTAEIRSDLNTKITFQDESGQIFVHNLKLSA